MTSAIAEEFYWANFGWVDGNFECFGWIILVEPDFESDDFGYSIDCEYCHTAKGYPTRLGIYNYLYCDDCRVKAQDDFNYDSRSYYV